MSRAADESIRTELHPGVRIGHVHLRVADLERATSFYRDVLGFDVTVYGADVGLPGAAFLAAGDYHHHIGLNTWQSQGGTPPPEGHTGLQHFAILYPDRRELGRAVQRLSERGYPIGGAEDHGATVSVYLRDPDGNGIELYYDRPREEWGPPRPNRSILASYWWGRAAPLSSYSPECVEGASLLRYNYYMWRPYFPVQTAMEGAMLS